MFCKQCYICGMCAANKNVSQYLYLIPFLEVLHIQATLHDNPRHVPPQGERELTAPLIKVQRVSLHGHGCCAIATWHIARHQCCTQYWSLLFIKHLRPVVQKIWVGIIWIWKSHFLLFRIKSFVLLLCRFYQSNIGLDHPNTQFSRLPNPDQQCSYQDNISQCELPAMSRTTGQHGVTLSRP